MGDIALTAAKIAVVNPEDAWIVPAVAGVTITAGQFVYGIVASGKVGLADEDASAEASFVYGMALTGGVDGQVIQVLRRGITEGFTLTSHAYWLPCSLSNTAGALLDTGATTNIVARIVPLTDAALTKVLLVDCTLANGAPAVS
jgi:hypothetical protein